MSIQGQIVVGSTGFNLAQIAKETLSLCTSDGATLAALTFLDAFGARFAVFSRVCDRIHEICTADQSTILGKLKVAVGYRKGDACAILASSSGGLSSIAFIIAATEMFDNEDIAWVMSEIANDAIPSSVAVPSTREIDVCINIIHHRCPDFDFCAHYSKLVTAIRRSRVAGGTGDMTTFDNLTCAPRPEDAIPLLRSILSCLHDDRTQLCIEGSESMGIIAAAASWWFPTSVQINSEDTIIWPCESSSPRCMIRVGSSCDTKWWRESALDSLSSLLPRQLPTLDQNRDRDDFWPDWSLQHPIQGFVQGALGSLGFPEGSECDRACFLISGLAFQLALSLYVDSGPAGQPKLLVDYVGRSPASLQHIIRSLMITCGSMPSQSENTALGSVHELEAIVITHVSSIWPTNCTCQKCPKKATGNWLGSGNDRCPLRRWRGFIGELILKVVLHFSIDSDYDFRVTIGSNIRELRNILGRMEMAWKGNRALIKLTELYGSIAAFLDVPWPDELALIGSSRYGICLYLPSAFWPEFRQDRLIRVRVAKGAFIHRGNYYQKLLVRQQLQNDVPPQHHESLELLTASTKLEPSFTRTIRETRFVVRELVENLEITVTVIDFSGRQQQIDLARAVRHARDADFVEPCSHLKTAGLDPQYEPLRVVKTSATTIPSESAPHCLVSAHGDHEAGLYSCDNDRRLIVADSSCVNCAYEHLCTTMSRHKSLVILFR